MAADNQDLYDAYREARSRYETVHTTVRDSQERFTPLASARQESKEAAQQVASERRQWANSDEARGLLKAERASRKEMKAAKAALDEAVVMTFARGEQLSLFEDGRALSVTLTAKYTASPEGAAVAAPEPDQE